MSGVRILWALVLYALARRVVSWPFAMLPFLAVAAVDAAPIFPEPHPSWPSILATLAAIEAVARHHERGGRRWIVAAGILAGLAFAFKQNIGAFAALAIGGYLLLLQERPRTGWLLRLGQVGFALVLGLAATVLLWPGLTVLLGVALWAPLVLTLVLLVWIAWRRSQTGGWTAGLVPVVLDGLAAGIPFVAVTLAWLVPLTLALGFSGVPWGLFVGQVNQGALILPLELPSPGARGALLVAIWLPLALAYLTGWPTRPQPRILLYALVGSLLAIVLPTAYSIDPSLSEEPTPFPWLGYLDAEFGTHFIYLPVLAAWAGLGMLLFGIVHSRPTTMLGWYLLAGGLTALSLYPRVDTIHAMFSGPPLLVVGAWAFAAAHRSLAGCSNVVAQVAVYIGLLVIPVVAVAPHVYWRYVSITHPNPRVAEPPPYVELGLERAQVLVPEFIAVSVRGAVEYVQAGTPPGAPFFAYPVDPLFNFLADRHNPTRFNHFIAGALTPSDLDEVIADLDEAKPRYILWDHGGATYFKADLTNRKLSDYIWGCYAQVANFTPYLILERHCP